MNISYCKELIALAEDLNFKKTATRLFITQSALSKHVAAAEKETGFRIFDRTTTHVSPTKAGRIFIERLKDVVSEYDEALTDGRKACSADATVTIMGPFLNQDVHSIVGKARYALMADNPELKVFVEETGIRDCTEKLMSNQVDIAIGFSYEACNANFVAKPLFDIPFGIACREENPLARLSPLRFRDLSGQTIINYPLEERRRYHSFVKSVCERHGIALDSSNVPAEALCLPNFEDDVVFGVYFADYARYGNGIVARRMDDTSDVFTVCAIRRANEENSSVLELFDAIGQCRSKNAAS